MTLGFAHMRGRLGALVLATVCLVLLMRWDPYTTSLFYAGGVPVSTLVWVETSLAHFLLALLGRTAFALPVLVLVWSLTGTTWKRFIAGVFVPVGLAPALTLLLPASPLKGGGLLGTTLSGFLPAVVCFALGALGVLAIIYALRLIPLLTFFRTQPRISIEPARRTSAPTSAPTPALTPAPTPTLTPAPVAAPPPAQPIQPEAPETPAPYTPPAVAKNTPLPPLSLLAPPVASTVTVDKKVLAERSNVLKSVLHDFKIPGVISSVLPGPMVTLFEFSPAPGVKSSRILSLADDIARSMEAQAARAAIIPERNAIGIELPNPKPSAVALRTLLQTPPNKSYKLPLALGTTIEGTPFFADLARMPHLLVAGTTGSGKSVAINAMILSLLFRFSPEQCRLVLIDPKMLELSVYGHIPHLLTPVVTDPQEAVRALRWAVREMERRYQVMATCNVRNVDGYNARMRKLGEKEMPTLVVVVDEMADLMLTAGKDIEAAIQRLAQMARAAGIHMIAATQRPSVDVITGTIKANFPTRISFRVTSKIDSRTILGEGGAEHLLGNGDMLFMNGGSAPARLHGPFVSDEEVAQIANFWRSRGQPEYLEEVVSEPATPEAEAGGSDLYTKAVALVREERRASTSYLQRRLQIGYNRAADLIERMEREGVVTPPDATGKRRVTSE